MLLFLLPILQEAANDLPPGLFFLARKLGTCWALYKLYKTWNFWSALKNAQHCPRVKACEQYRFQEWLWSLAALICVAKWMIKRQITKATSLFIANTRTRAKGKLATDTGCVSGMKPGICLPLEWPCVATTAFLPPSSMVPLCRCVQLAVQES